MTLNAKIGVFNEFFWQFRAVKHISKANCVEIKIDVEKQHMKFSAFNVDFDNSDLDFFRFKETCARGHQRAVAP